MLCNVPDGSNSVLGFCDGPQVRCQNGSECVMNSPVRFDWANGSTNGTCALTASNGHEVGAEGAGWCDNCGQLDGKGVGGAWKWIVVGTKSGPSISKVLESSSELSPLSIGQLGMMGMSPGLFNGE